MNAKDLLFVALTIFLVGYLLVFIRGVQHARRRHEDAMAPAPVHFLIGFVTNFFDTLGIGSFATTTSLFRVLGVVPDELIPGTLNVGHTVPSVTQAFIVVCCVAMC